MTNEHIEEFDTPTAQWIAPTAELGIVENDGCVQEKQWGSPEAEQLMETSPTRDEAKTGLTWKRIVTL